MARRGAQPPDARHPFGYGREIYFWAFVVAMLIFAVGAGVSLYEGVVHYRHPSPLENPTVNYIVLALAFLLEGISWSIAVRDLARQPGSGGWWQVLRRSKDPSSFIVLFEDSAALIGLVLAAVGVWASHWFVDARLDGVASMAIGAVLAGVAVLLARHAHGLIIGAAADPALTRLIRETIDRHPEITAVNHVRTLHSAPEVVFVAVSADFADDLSMGDGERVIEEIETRLRALSPKIGPIYIRPERREDALVFDE